MSSPSTCSTSTSTSSGPITLETIRCADCNSPYSFQDRLGHRAVCKARRVASVFLSQDHFWCTDCSKYYPRKELLNHRSACRGVPYPPVSRHPDEHKRGQSVVRRVAFDLPDDSDDSDSSGYYSDSDSYVSDGTDVDYSSNDDDYSSDDDDFVDYCSQIDRLRHSKDNEQWDLGSAPASISSVPLSASHATPFNTGLPVPPTTFMSQTENPGFLPYRREGSARVPPDADLLPSFSKEVGGCVSLGHARATSESNSMKRQSLGHHSTRSLPDVATSMDANSRHPPRASQARPLSNLLFDSSIWGPPSASHKSHKSNPF
ncbi:uncharacterized protein FIBRA_08021 [Fibroporia radiculosa]|uniref:Uncharacterized protein n=1 Tax=Fibroporia radiculosa TaxID=599839 RepID=J4GG78_9APHY|nr:uncharacterized protein FIBRA_08021 [Fibroporia radiculosa]CCM05788.1 predicted protein [Fibroporia radiculosa]